MGWLVTPTVYTGRSHPTPAISPHPTQAEVVCSLEDILKNSRKSELT